jgi:tRNA (mo5U34)-methyltransferase
MSAKLRSGDPFDYVRGWQAEREQKGWWHSFELPDGTIIHGVNPLQGMRDRISKFGIAQDLSGKRVLDIGTWDGWFAFEMERRGADVVAIDNWDNPRFREIHAKLNSHVDYQQLDVYELTPERIGYFDVVLFMGVLYHLKHPLLALEMVCALTKELAAVDSFILRDKHLPHTNLTGRPIMEFYETDEFGGQTDNWVGPSLACLMAFCRTAGFARVEHRATLEHNAALACHRVWEPPPKNADSGPELLDVFHDKKFGINFNSRKDEYVTARFRSGLPKVTLADVKPQVGDYGVHPIHLDRRKANMWEVTFKLPPGLTPGMYEARVRIAHSTPSNARRVAVDMPLAVESLEIESVLDGITWKQNEVDLSKGHSLSLWAIGLPPNADKTNVRVYIGGNPRDVTFVKLADTGSHQINADIDPSSDAGEYEIEIECTGVRSSARTFTLSRQDGC